MLFLLYKLLFVTQDMEKEELPSHMTAVSMVEIKRVSPFLFPACSDSLGGCFHLQEASSH